MWFIYQNILTLVLLPPLMTSGLENLTTYALGFSKNSIVSPSLMGEKLTS